jgi:hypothetical protein
VYQQSSRVEALLSSLEMLVEMAAREVAIFGDSKLVVQQVTRESQCLDGVLNECHEKCMDILNVLDGYNVIHVPREANERANGLAQQAPGYEVRRGKFEIRPKSMPCSMMIVQNKNVSQTRMKKSYQPIGGREGGIDQMHQ